MLRTSVFAILMPSLFGQSLSELLEKAPPAVEQAVRARVSTFYQLHMDAKFRQAEALVSEECKDFFYSANKPKYLGFEIKGITWSENYTKAKVTIMAKQVILLPGFAGEPMSVPFASDWKLVNGEWYWYVDLDKVNETPFGKMRPGAGGSGGGIPAPTQMMDVETVQRMVQADRLQVQLKAAKDSTESVSIANKMPGAVSVSLETVPAGILARLESDQIKAGDKTTLTMQWKAGSPIPGGPVPVQVRVQPTNQLITVRVTIVRPK